MKGIADQQVAEAKKLLSDAGYPKGKGLPPLVVKVEQGQHDMKTSSRKWPSVEVPHRSECRVKEVDPDAYLAETRKKDFTLAESTWIGDYADPSHSSSSGQRAAT